MAANSYIGVAPDGSGKLVLMASDTGFAVGDAVTRPADGTAVYVQAAVIVGAAADALQQLIALNQQQVQLLKAITAQLGATTNFSVNPDDYQ